jgi:hypothetical protein
VADEKKKVYKLLGIVLSSAEVAAAGKVPACPTSKMHVLGKFL